MEQVWMMRTERPKNAPRINWKIRAQEAEARILRLEEVLSRIARQGPYDGVDGLSWKHWATIAEEALQQT